MSNQFASGHVYDPAHPHALAVYCSDGRFTQSVEELLGALGHDRLDTLTIPGGPALLDLTSSSMGALEALRSAATFLIKGHGISRVVLLAHAGCGYYKSRFPYESPEAMHRRQLSDLGRAAKWVKSEHAKIEVATFYASPEGKRVRFEEIES